MSFYKAFSRPEIEEKVNYYLRESCREIGPYFAANSNEQRCDLWASGVKKTWAADMPKIRFEKRETIM